MDWLHGIDPPGRRHNLKQKLLEPARQHLAEVALARLNLGPPFLLGHAVAALIFDFDGVIADSEALANTVLAEFVTNLGQPTTLDDALARYCGRRWGDVLVAIESAVGRPLPADFSDDLKAATLDRFRNDLREVRGSTAFIRRFSDFPRCIASSSSADRLQLCLAILGLEDSFGANVFSADMVSRGKPHPDIFLFAAEKLGVDPGSCLVIEDSAGGIKAAVAAGMTVVGLCAGSHVRPGHDLRLREAGATHLASSWDEVAAFAELFLDRASGLRV